MTRYNWWRHSQGEKIASLGQGSGLSPDSVASGCWTYLRTVLCKMKLTPLPPPASILASASSVLFSVSGRRQKRPVSWMMCSLILLLLNTSNSECKWHFYTGTGLNSLDKLFTTDNSTCSQGRMQWMSDDIKKTPKAATNSSSQWSQWQSILLTSKGAPCQWAHTWLLFSGTHLHLELKPRQQFLFWGAQTSAVWHSRAARAWALLQLWVKAGLLSKLK